jgi:hypothetical protein
MKKFNNRIKWTLAVFTSVLLLMISSCSLDEDIYSIYTPETFYSNDYQVLSSLSGVYRGFATIPTFGAPYRVLELCTDHVVTHGKIQGWWYNSSFEQLQIHTWDAGHSYIKGFWNTLFQTVGRTNALIVSLENSGLEVTSALAELKVLRAYSYFYLMDLFGNVPIFTDEKVDPLNLPEQNTRTEVFDFIIQELNAAVVDLPAQDDVGAEYYGRLTQEAVYALLSYIYLNAEVYTGTARWAECITNADKVLAGPYELLPDYFDNFVADNEHNAEAIWSGVYTPDISGGIGHPIVLKVLPGIAGGLFGLPYTPQNGMGTRPSVRDAYEAGDDRLELFIDWGPLIDPRNGDTVMVERIVPDHNSTLYEEGVSTEGPVPYEIIPATDYKEQPMNAGIKWIKWQLDPNTSGGSAGNDIAWFRLADIMLIKAEALVRSGGDAGTALQLVNDVRTRSNAAELTALTLDDIFMERGRELVFEMKRRNDLIRFDKFNDAWEFKPANPNDQFRKIFPIPTAALDANPNLTQNPGYN